MTQQSRKKQLKSSSVKWNSTYIPGTSNREAELFWEWFLEANPDISSHDFLAEMKRDNNPANVLERLFVKMNKSMTKH
jgi:hypothetical protein